MDATQRQAWHGDDVADWEDAIRLDAFAMGQDVLDAEAKAELDAERLNERYFEGGRWA